MYQKIVIVGNLGRDPEMRYTPSGQAVTNFSVATTRKWSDGNGQTREETIWFRVATWGKLAEVCNQYLAKGVKYLWKAGWRLIRKRAARASGRRKTVLLAPAMRSPRSRSNSSVGVATLLLLMKMAAARQSLMNPPASPKTKSRSKDCIVSINCIATPTDKQKASGKRQGLFVVEVSEVQTLLWFE